MEAAESDWLAAFDKAKLTPRYYATIALLVLQEMFEFYDFFVVGFIVAVIGPGWHLTYGQSAIMLLAAGVGAIVGALAFGRLSDRFGRRSLTAWAGVFFSAGAAGCALLPDGAWIGFSFFRFLVGFGLAGAVATQNALIIEMTPTRHRTFVSSLMVAPVSFGTLLAATVSSTLLPIIGWRGLAATGALPILISIAMPFVAPESVRWLLTRNRFADARREAAKQLGVPVESMALPVTALSPVAPVPLSELLQDKKRFWWVLAIWGGSSTATYGVQLWGPTILALLLHITAKDAAGYFVALALCAIAGRVAFALLPLWVGRRHSGEIMGYGSTLILLGAAFFYQDFVFGWSVFALLIVAGAALYSGGFANMTPYTAEVFPVRLAARSLGLGQAANGVGKVLGPLCLALIAGSSDVVSPKATEAAVFPAFLFLATCSLMAAIAFTLYRVETHGRPLSLRDSVQPGFSKGNRPLAGFGGRAPSFYAFKVAIMGAA